MEFDIAKPRKFYHCARTYTALSRQHLVTSPANVHYGSYVPEMLGWRRTMVEPIKRFGAGKIVAAIPDLSQFVLSQFI
jgi:hypothetical protein